MPEFFETKMGRQFYDGTMPRLTKALESIAASLEQQQTAREVAALLDGREWSPDTLDLIAATLRTAGYTIREPKR